MREQDPNRYYGSYRDAQAPYEGDMGDEIDLRNLLWILYRRRWTAATVLVLVVLATAVVTFTATPIYEARAQLLIAPEAPNVVSFQEVIEQNIATSEYYQTQHNLLRSRSLARRTMDALNLWEHPDFGGGDATAPTGLRAMIDAGLGWFSGLLSGSSGSEPGKPEPGESAAQSAQIDGFLGRLTVTPVRNSRIVELRFSSPHPDVAADVVNALIKQYVEQNLEFQFVSTKEASDWLSTQLDDQRKKLESSEQALQQYLEGGDALSLDDGQNIVVQRLTELNAAVTKARTERIGKEALYQQLVRLESDRAALDTFPAILSNTFIQGLKSELSDLQRQQAQMAERLGEKHPDMIKVATAIEATRAKLQTEISKVVESVRNEFLSAQSQERSLAGELERQKADALALNRKAIDYNVLKREAEGDKQIYDSLMQRAKEMGVSRDLKASNIRLVDQAEVPRAPVRPNKRTNLLLGLLGGLVAGIGFAFGLEFIDQRIKNPEEVKRGLGLPFLGMVPDMSSRDGRLARNFTAGMVHGYTEAFRSIRTNLVMSSTEEGSRAIVVTSSQPGEGKSAVASSLAIAMAEAGHTVLLIDADMRKPNQHRVFQLNREPGLSRMLTGGIDASEAMQKTHVDGLWMLPAGPTPPNPSELLGSERFKRFLATVREHFEWIVIDTPPVLAVTDAAVVAHHATGAIFVVGCEQVNKAVARQALEELASARAQVLGAVLNRVSVQKHPRYYAHYYRGKYAGYYGAVGGAAQ